MGFSPKRAKQLRTGQVVFNIYDDQGNLFESCPTFLIAVKRVDFLQQVYPNTKWDMKVEVKKDDQVSNLCP